MLINQYSTGLFVSYFTHGKTKLYEISLHPIKSALCHLVHIELD
jgi:hypothetical protein